MNNKCVKCSGNIKQNYNPSPTDKPSARIICDRCALEMKSITLIHKWFHGMADDEMFEFVAVLEELLADVKHSLYS